MPTPEQWDKQHRELLELGVNVYEGEDIGSVLYTLCEALIASITHLQRHDGAIEALAEAMKAHAPNDAL